MTSARRLACAKLFMALGFLSLPFQSCDSGTDTPAKINPPAAAGNSQEFSYTLQGDVMVFSYPNQSTDTYIYCTYRQGGASSTADSMVTEKYTPDSTETMRWSIVKDTLTLTGIEPDYTYGDSIPYVGESRYLRLSGTGLNGRFRYIGARSIPLGPIPEGSSDTIYFTDNDFQSTYLKFYEVVLEFREGKIRSTSTPLGSWADYQIAEWDDDDMDNYDITIRKIDERTVTETGNISKEVVTRTLIRAEPEDPHFGDVRYSSSDPTHKAGVEYFTPTSCPNGVDWYWDFRWDNWKDRNSSQSSAPRSMGTVPTVSTSQHPRRGSPTLPGRFSAR